MKIFKICFTNDILLTLSKGRFLKQDTQNACQLKILFVQKTFEKKKQRQDTDEERY